jgi:ABC-type ATPase with predicted acetyltransferase domain
MKELQDLGYTENGMGGAVVCKLNYADYAGERVIEIRDFDEENLHLYYMAWKEEKRLIHCEECGKVVLANGNKTQYCEQCATERIEERNRNRKK